MSSADDELSPSPSPQLREHKSRSVCGEPIDRDEQKPLGERVLSLNNDDFTKLLIKAFDVRLQPPKKADETSSVGGEESKTTDILKDLQAEVKANRQLEKAQQEEQYRQTLIAAGLEEQETTRGQLIANIIGVTGMLRAASRRNPIVNSNLANRPSPSTLSRAQAAHVPRPFDVEGIELIDSGIDDFMMERSALYEEISMMEEGQAASPDGTDTVANGVRRMANGTSSAGTTGEPMVNGTTGPGRMVFTRGNTESHVTEFYNDVESVATVTATISLTAKHRDNGVYRTEYGPVIGPHQDHLSSLPSRVDQPLATDRKSINQKMDNRMFAANSFDLIRVKPLVQKEQNGEREAEQSQLHRGREMNTPCSMEHVRSVLKRTQPGGRNAEGKGAHKMTVKESAWTGELTNASLEAIVAQIEGKDYKEDENTKGKKSKKKKQQQSSTAQEPSAASPPEKKKQSPEKSGDKQQLSKDASVKKSPESTAPELSVDTASTKAPATAPATTSGKKAKKDANTVASVVAAAASASVAASSAPHPAPEEAAVPRGASTTTAPTTPAAIGANQSGGAVAVAAPQQVAKATVIATGGKSSPTVSAKVSIAAASINNNNNSTTSSKGGKKEQTTSASSGQQTTKKMENAHPQQQTPRSRIASSARPRPSSDDGDDEFVSADEAPVWSKEEFRPTSDVLLDGNNFMNDDVPAEEIEAAMKKNEEVFIPVSSKNKKKSAASQSQSTQHHQGGRSGTNGPYQHHQQQYHNPNQQHNVQHLQHRGYAAAISAAVNASVAERKGSVSGASVASTTSGKNWSHQHQQHSSTNGTAKQLLQHRASTSSTSGPTVKKVGQHASTEDSPVHAASARVSPDAASTPLALETYASAETTPVLSPMVASASDDLSSASAAAPPAPSKFSYADAAKRNSGANSRQGSPGSGSPPSGPSTAVSPRPGSTAAASTQAVAPDTAKDAAAAAAVKSQSAASTALTKAPEDATGQPPTTATGQPSIGQKSATDSTAATKSTSEYNFFYDENEDEPRREATAVHEEVAESTSSTSSGAPSSAAAPAALVLQLSGGAVLNLPEMLPASVVMSEAHAEQIEMMRKHWETFVRMPGEMVRHVCGEDRNRH